MSTDYYARFFTSYFMDRYNQFIDELQIPSNIINKIIKQIHKIIQNIEMFRINFKQIEINASYVRNLVKGLYQIDKKLTTNIASSIMEINEIVKMIVEKQLHLKEIQQNVFEQYAKELTQLQNSTASNKQFNQKLDHEILQLDKNQPHIEIFEQIFRKKQAFMKIIKEKEKWYKNHVKKIQKFFKQQQKFMPIFNNSQPIKSFQKRHRKHIIKQKKVFKRSVPNYFHRNPSDFLHFNGNHYGQLTINYLDQEQMCEKYEKMEIQANQKMIKQSY